MPFWLVLAISKPAKDSNLFRVSAKSGKSGKSQGIHFTPERRNMPFWLVLAISMAAKDPNLPFTYERFIQ